MPETVIHLRVQDDGTLSLLDQAGQKIEELGRVTQGANSKSYNTFNELTAGIKDILNPLSELHSAVAGSVGIIADLNELGVTSLRAKDALQTLSNGQGGSSLDAMRASSKGLVDDFTLAKDASLALATGVVHSKDQLAELAKDGATLGLALGGNATSGVEQLSTALEHVGNKRSLMTLGVDVHSVEEEFKLLKDTMSDSDAWAKAVLDNADVSANKLSGSLEGSGTEVDKLTVKWNNAKAAVGEYVAATINADLKLAGTLASQTQDRQATVQGIIDDKGKRGIALTPAERMFQVTGLFVGDINAETSTYDKQKYGPTTNTGPHSSQDDAMQGAYWQNFIGSMLPNALNSPQSLMQTASGIFGPGQQRLGVGDNMPQSWLFPLGMANQMAAAQNAKAQSLTGPYGGSASYDYGIPSGENFTTGQQTAADSTVAYNFLKGAINGVGDALHSAGKEAQSLNGYMQDAAKSTNDFKTIKEAFGLDGSNGILGIATELEPGLQSSADSYLASLKKKIGTSEYGGTAGFTPDMKAFGKQQSAESDQFRLDHMMDKDYGKEHKQFEYDQLKSKVGYENSGKAGSGGGPVYTKAMYEAEADSVKATFDDYAVATGAATKESLAFRDATDNVNKMVSTSALTVKQGADALLAYAEAARRSGAEANILGITVRTNLMAKDDPASLAQLNSMNKLLGNQGEGFKPRTAFEKMTSDYQTIEGMPTGLGTQKGEDDPFLTIKRHAGETQDTINGIANVTTTLASRMSKPATDAAQTLIPINANALAAKNTIEAMINSLKGATGTLTINVGFNQTGGSTPGIRQGGVMNGGGNGFRGGA